MSLYVNIDSYDDHFYGSDIMAAILTLTDLLENPEYESEYSDIQDELDRYVLLRDTVTEALGDSGMEDSIALASVIHYPYFETTYANDQANDEFGLLDNGAWKFFDYDAWQAHLLEDFREVFWDGCVYLVS